MMADLSPVDVGLLRRNLRAGIGMGVGFLATTAIRFAQSVNGPPHMTWKAIAVITLFGGAVGAALSRRATTKRNAAAEPLSPTHEPLVTAPAVAPPTDPLARWLLRIGAWSTPIFIIVAGGWLLSSTLIAPHKSTHDGVTTVTYAWWIGIVGLVVGGTSAAATWYLAQQPHELVIRRWRHGRYREDRASYTYLFLAILGVAMVAVDVFHRVTISDHELRYRSLVAVGHISFDDLQRVSYEEVIGRDSKGRETRTHHMAFHLRSGVTETLTPGPLLFRALPELVAKLKARGLQLEDHTSGLFAQILQDATIADLPPEKQAAVREALKPPPPPTAAENAAALQLNETRLKEERLAGLAGTRWIGHIDLMGISLEFDDASAIHLVQDQKAPFPEFPDRHAEFRAQTTRQGDRVQWTFEDDSVLTATLSMITLDLLRIEPHTSSLTGQAQQSAELVRHGFRRAP